jgi:hypothetical protein
MKGNVSADYPAFTTWLEVRGDHYLLDVCRGQLEFPDLVKRALEQSTTTGQMEFSSRTRYRELLLSSTCAGTLAYAANPLPSDVGREHWIESVPPHANCFVTNIDPPLCQ